MKRTYLIALFSGLLVLGSCGKKEGAASSLISGEDSKVWKASKELDRTGEKEKLSKDEKKEELRFYSNGTFTVHGETDHQNGKWKYDATQKTLSLQYEGQKVSENFAVAELDEDDMILQAPDGSKMILESEE